MLHKHPFPSSASRFSFLSQHSPSQHHPHHRSQMVSPTSPSYSALSAASPYSSGSSASFPNEGSPISEPFEPIPEAEKDSGIRNDYLAYSTSMPAPVIPFSMQGQLTYSTEQESQVFVYPSSTIMPWSPDGKQQQLRHPLQQHHLPLQQYHQKPSQLALNLPELDQVKSLPMYTPPSIPIPSQQQHSPMLHSPVLDHLVNAPSHQSHQISNDGLFPIDVDDWNSPTTLHPSYPNTHPNSHPHSIAINQNPYATPVNVKQEDLTIYTSLGPYVSTQNQHHQDPQSQNHSHNYVFDLSSPVSQNPHLPHPPSSFAHPIVDPYYDNPHQYQQQQQRFVYPAALSPPESPASPLQEYPDGQSCDPRFVGGMLDEPRENTDGWITEEGEHEAENSKMNEHGCLLRTEMGTPNGIGDLDVHGDDADAEGEEDLDLDADACNDTDADADWDVDDGDFDAENDEDDGDGDFVVRRGRCSSDSAIIGESRTLRLRSATSKSSGTMAAARYNPYGYPNASSPSQSHHSDQPLQAQPHASQTRLRRTSAGATVSSRSNSSSTHPSSRAAESNGAGHRRSRASSSLSVPIPVPVPNLTKKSRGRRVPTVSSIEYGRGRLQGGDDEEFNVGVARRGGTGTKGARMYTCKVAGCGKCFARGEHLKRHVRSIHTYEKPHKCPHPGCGKDFSRHDNLGQHMRVHKDYATGHGKRA